MGVKVRAEPLRRNVELQEVVVYRFEGKEKQFVLNSLFNRKPVNDVKDRRYVVRWEEQP